MRKGRQNFFCFFLKIKINEKKQKHSLIKMPYWKIFWPIHIESLEILPSTTTAASTDDDDDNN